MCCLVLQPENTLAAEHPVYVVDVCINILVEFSGGCCSGVGAMHTPQLYEII